MSTASLPLRRATVRPIVIAALAAVARLEWHRSDGRGQAGARRGRQADHRPGARRVG